MTERPERCDRCYFWEPDGYAPWKDAHPDEWKGGCHRKAPCVYQGLVSDVARLIGAIAWATEETANIEHDDDVDYRCEARSQHELGDWPRTDAAEWCGDFKAK